MNRISLDMRRRVVRRARKQCEYCRLSQRGQEATCHIDHVVPLAHGGLTVYSNLALACVGCSLHKAARLTGTDPQTGIRAKLYHPRMQRWKDHFELVGQRIVGISAVGRATVAALQINRRVSITLRSVGGISRGKTKD